MSTSDLAQFDELKANITVFVQPIQSITVISSETHEIASKTLKTIKEMQKTVEARRKEVVKPLNDRVKQINSYADAIGSPLVTAENHLKACMAEFHVIELKRIEAEKKRQLEEQQAEERRQAEIRRKADEEARAKLNAEKERLAQEAEMLAAFGGSQDIKAAEDALAKLEKENAVEAARLEREAKEKVRDIKAQTAQIEASRPKNMSTVRKFEIIDPSLVPEEFWVIDQIKLGIAVRGGREDIPGVKITAQSIVVAR